MKKRMNEIFDEAKPEELDQFSDELNAPKLSDEVLASVKGKVYAKTSLKKEKTNNRGMWLRFGSISACFLLIISAIIAVPMLREDDPGVIASPSDTSGNEHSGTDAEQDTAQDPKDEPYTPAGESWSPMIGSDVFEIILSADKAGSVFELMDNGTNQYTKFYSSDPRYLNLVPLTTAEYLPIYSSKNFDLSENKLEEFIDEHLDMAATLFDLGSEDRTIERSESADGDVYYQVKASGDYKSVFFTKQNNLLLFYNYNGNAKRMTIKGDLISVMESDTDRQIQEKLKDTISYVCSSFGKNYSDIRIRRYYNDRQLLSITIYLYSEPSSYFPSNFSEHPMSSDYLALTFYTDWGDGTLYSWGGSKEEAFLSRISYYESLLDFDEYYCVEGKSKMLTLEEAKELLSKGYVFGGHSCDLCMKLQPDVDFSDYTYVDIEYVSDENGMLYFPFYAFYKYIGKTASGLDTYAKTYVPAVVVSGYEEYFEIQKENHKSAFDEEVIE